jgi:outer membrane cobalamin receptor
MSLRVGIAAVLFVGGMASLEAEEATQPPRLEMVVTVERQSQEREEAAAAISVLHRQDLQQLPVTSLAEALALVPGITMMFDSGSSGTPMITSRGFFGGGEVEYVKLLVDGVPVGDPESGLADWQRFRLGGIDRIEILHGPGSAMYGDAALGGVIQLFTRRDASGGSHGDLRVDGGSFGSRSAEAGYVAELGTVRLGVRGAYGSTDGFRQNASRNDRDGEVTFDRLLDHSRWRASLSIARKDRREPGPLTAAEIAADRTQSDPLFRFDREVTRRDRLSAGYDAFGSGTLHLQAYAAHRDSDNLRTLLLAPGFGVTALRALNTRAGGGSGDYSHPLLGGNVHAGADVERTSLDGDYRGVDPATGGRGALLVSESGHRDNVGLFLTGAWDVCGRCTATAGLRRDDIRDTFGARSQRATAWSPRAGFNVRLGGDGAPAPVSLFVQLSRAFKAPTLDQLFDPRPYPDFQGGTFTVSNPDLKPQHAQNVEAGISRSGGPLHWSLVAYRMHVTDEIDFDPRTFAYLNIGSSVHRGVEASAGTSSAAPVSALVTYAWTRVADEANRHQQLKNIPEHVAQVIVRARFPRQITGDVAYRWMHGRFLDDDGLFQEPDVSRIDLRLSRPVGPARIDLDVLNAGDSHYNELGYVLADFQGRPTPLQFPAPGRSVRLGVVWTY